MKLGEYNCAEYSGSCTIMNFDFQENVQEVTSGDSLDPSNNACSKKWKAIPDWRKARSDRRGDFFLV
jgi:hypothetical protein